MRAIPISTFGGGRPHFNLLPPRLQIRGFSIIYLLYVSTIFTVRYSTLLIVAKSLQTYV